MQYALLLNGDYSPLQTISMKKAIALLLREKAELVEGYVNQVVRTVTSSLAYPAVIRLRQYVNFRHKIDFNRLHVLTRDHYRCAYCGAQPKTPQGSPDLHQLTIDHIIPRSQAVNNKVTLRDGRTVGCTSWLNVVTACDSCNFKKANRTPQQARMPLLFEPRIPSAVDAVLIRLRRVSIPEEWKNYLPADSEWKNYWDAELGD